MDPLEKEKLERELEFLKESFESNVISEEEYDSARERIRSLMKQDGQKPKKAEEDIDGELLKRIEEEKVSVEEAAKRAEEEDKKSEEIEFETYEDSEEPKDEEPSL